MTSLGKESSSTAPEAADFEPIKVLEVEIGQPFPAVPAVDVVTGQRYEKGLVLVRLHTQPLGVVELQLGDDGVSPAGYARQIWGSFGHQINDHLRQDGLPQVTALEATGLPGPTTPNCVEEREELLASAPFVSVMVATRDRTETLAGTLSTLLSMDYPHYDIIVVDSAPSTNATADFIAHSYGDSDRVRYVREDHPGLAIAHNTGLKEVVAPIVAFTDDDVLVDKYWLAEIVKGFSAAANVGCVTGLTRPAELETYAQWLFEQYGGFGKGFATRIFDLAENQPKSPLYPYAAGWFGTGANMAFKTSALHDLGGFAPALGAGTLALGGDDLDSFFRVVSTGHQLVYQPSAIVHHFHRRDYAGLRKQAYGYGVGLTAYLTKAVIDRSSRIFSLAAKIPFGISYVFNSESPKNVKKSVSYPEELTRMERKGMLYGPIAYLRSRRKHRTMMKEAARLHKKTDHHLANDYNSN